MNLSIKSFFAIGEVTNGFPFKSGIPLIDAAADGDLPILQKLIAQGKDLEVRDDSGRDFPEKMACAKALLYADQVPGRY